MNPYVSPLGKEWSRATGGLLAQSAGGEDGGIEGMEGAAVWSPSKRPARRARSSQTVGGIKTTGSRQRALSRRHTCCPLLLLLSSSVQRWQPRM